MPEAGHSEAGEDADRIDRDEGVDLAPVAIMQRNRDAGQQDDPVGERQAMATADQRRGRKASLGHEAGQERKAVEARVRPRSRG